jgi:hypothetical protein
MKLTGYLRGLSIMKRTMLRALLTILAFAILSAVAGVVQARLRSAVAIERRPVQLQREWVWQRKAVTFDGMIRERKD